MNSAREAFVEAKTGPGHTHGEACEVQDAVCKCGYAKETAKRCGNFELVICAGKVSFGSVRVIVVDDISSKVGHVIHSERWGCIKATVDTLAVEN